MQNCGLLSLLLLLRKFPLAALLSLSGISAELVFLMRQFLEYHTLCQFCLVVAAGVIAVAVFSFSLVRLSLREVFMTASILFSFSLAFLLTRIPVSPITSDKVLIYSPSCPHCERVIQFCKEQGIDLSLCRETNVRGILYCLGVKGVPALLIRKQGEGNVMAYLLEKENEQNLLLFPQQDEGVCSVGKTCE